MSDQEVVVVGKRKTNRLNLDSEQEARLQAEQQARLQQIRQRKQEKRRRKEEEVRREQEQNKRRIQLQKKYQNPQTMLQEDSNSNDSFSRVEKKIRKAFPEFRAREEIARRRHQSQSEQSQQQSDEEEESEQQSESNHKKKVQKKVKRERKMAQESEEVRQPRHKVERVKIEQLDPKERLVKQVAVRWWYCLPDWPPADYPYEQELRKLGYRLVDQTRFKMQQNQVNGLFKAAPVDGYVGVFRTKQKIIDIRPKETAPSLRFLRNRTIEELTELLRKALKAQVHQLNSQAYHQSEELELLQQLQGRLNQLS